MLSEDKHIASSSNRVWLDIWNGVLIGEARRSVLRLEQSLEFHIVETDQRQVVILFVENRQFDAEHFLVPAGTSNRQLVIGDHEGALLRRRQMLQDDDWNFFHPECACGAQPCVTRNNDVVGADQDWICEAELLD